MLEVSDERAFRAFSVRRAPRSVFPA